MTHNIDKSKYYTFYYTNGEKAYLRGCSLGDALERDPDKSRGSLHAIDFVIPGIDDNYIWCNGYWAKKAGAGAYEFYVNMPLDPRD